MATDEPLPTRILMANLTETLTRLIVDIVSQHLQMQIVGQVQGQIEVLFAAQGGVDMVILGAPHLKPAPGLVSHILSEFPDTKILVLSTTEERGTGYWLGVRRCRFDYATDESLLTSIQTLSKITPGV
jgi:hypothetical protein